MKSGRSLQEIAAELDRQRATKRDFMADTRNLIVETQGIATPPGEPVPAPQIVGRLHAESGKAEKFPVRNTALRQIEDHVGIPAKFSDRLLEKHPDLLVHNLNTLLHRAPSTQLVRVLDGRMRAFLSSSYRIIDNYDYAGAVLEVAGKFNCRVVSSEVTEHRLYIKVVREDLMETIGYQPGWRQGEGHNLYNRIQAAAVFSNSEIGSGALWFRPAVFTRECTNLAVWEEESFGKVHLGKKGSAGEDGYWEILSDKTKELSDAALWSQVRDLTAAALGGKFFAKQVEALKGATERKIEGDPAKTVELTAKTFQLSEMERGGLLKHLIEGGSLTQYGLHAAVTRMSADVADYDRASELERLGGRIIELPQDQWKTLARAA